VLKVNKLFATGATLNDLDVLEKCLMHNTLLIIQPAATADRLLEIRFLISIHLKRLVRVKHPYNLD
jgi:hypothetical protein